MGDPLTPASQIKRQPLFCPLLERNGVPTFPKNAPPKAQKNWVEMGLVGEPPKK